MAVQYHAAFHFNIMMSSLVFGSMAYDTLSTHSTLYTYISIAIFDMYHFCDSTNFSLSDNILTHYQKPIIILTH